VFAKSGIDSCLRTADMALGTVQPSAS